MDEGEPLLGTAKRSNYRLKMNFSANKSAPEPTLAPSPSADRAHGKQCVEMKLWPELGQSSVQHTDIFQTKATESHKKLSFLTA